MAWSTPLTAVSNSTLTAAQWNASVRDNLLETAPAKATTAGRIFVTTGANALAERAIATASVLTAEATGATSYTNLTTVGPSVSVTTGTQAIVTFSAELSNNTTGNRCFVAVAVSGATTVAASDDECLRYQAYGGNAGHRGATSVMFTGLTPGTNTFTMQYHVDGGTGTFQRRRLIVIAL